MLTMVSRFAPAVVPGAVVDGESEDLLVPVSGGRTRVSLASLREHWVAQSGPGREEVVRRWLAGVASETNAGAAPADPMSSLPAAEQLRLRVMPAWDPAALAGVAASAVPLTFDAVVVYPDTAGRPAYLANAAAQAYGGVDAAVTIAVQQTILAELADLSVTEHDIDGHPLRLVSSPGQPFVTTALISLARFLPSRPAAGAVVLAPSYDTLVVRAVERRNDLNAIPMMTAMARERFAQADDACSPKVYYWHDGVFYPVRSEPNGAVSLPPELQPVLSSLLDE